MKFSKYNIFSKINDSDNYYLINILTGNADILTPDMAKEVMENNISNKDEFIEKGYLCDESEEKKLFISKYFDFIENRDKDEVQIFFVPWYACNFSCSYCYQSGYENEAKPLSNEVIDSFFNYIKKEFASRRKYITIFGGEPLLPGKRTHDTIEYILDKASELNIDTAFVTNGYCLDEYVPLFKDKKIREVQVTLDGVGKMHNERRPLKNMGPTFEKIVHGIDMALENNLTINLRAVIDKGNITCLNDLAGFAIEKGWTKSPFFKTQLGRNYELHYCQPGNSKLMTRLEFYEEIYNQLKENPQIIEFYKPAFSISKFLFENGELPSPLFDDCTGCKTEWAFDHTGNIYACTATVGKPGSSLGTFYPEVTKKQDSIEEWENRDVTTINECKDCSLQLACGGGCAEVAFNRTGKLNSPDCRPVKELMSMGISYYFNKELS
jgi:uncharacterized protein